jgi:hypothetical protein
LGVSAEAEKPEDEEHDHHSADDVDDVVHGRSSCICVERSSPRRFSLAACRKSERLAAIAGNMRKPIGGLAHSSSMLDILAMTMSLRRNPMEWGRQMLPRNPVPIRVPDDITHLKQSAVAKLPENHPDLDGYQCACGDKSSKFEMLIRLPV